MTLLRLLRHGLLSLLLLSGMLGAAEVQRRYSGVVGTHRAEFTLVWRDDGTVYGTYYCPDGKRTAYQLEGDNLVPGKLELKEYTAEKLTAHISLTKDPAATSIVWSGQLRNVDGRVLPVAFGRDPKDTTNTSAEGAGKLYYAEMQHPLTGKTLATRCQLEWGQDGQVEGALLDPATGGIILLSARNVSEGELWGMSVWPGGEEFVFRLAKNSRAGVVRWQGTFLKAVVEETPKKKRSKKEVPTTYKVVGRLELLRSTRDPQPVTDKSDLYQQEEVKIASETHWSEPAWATKPLKGRTEKSFYRLESAGRGFPAVIKSVSHFEGRLTVKLTLLPDEDEDELKTYFPVPSEVALHAAYPRTLSFLRPGHKVLAWVGPKGELENLYFNEFAITHWRARPDGLVEVQALPHSRRAAGSSPAVQKLHSLEGQLVPLVPDKLGIHRHKVSPDGGQFFRSLSFERDYGLVLRSHVAGPAELELEAAPSKLQPPGEAPWISVFEQGPGAAVQASQAVEDL